MEQTNMMRSIAASETPPVKVEPLLTSYQPQFDMDFVKRLLGLQKAGSLSRSTRNRLEQMHDAVQQLLRPRVVWEVIPLAAIEKKHIKLSSGLHLKSSKMAKVMTGAVYMVCFVATVGKKIDERIYHLMEQGKFANAYICDALGSGAVEAIAERFHSDFNRNFLQETSVSASGIRFSPGYCDWPVTEQQKLFSLVNADAIGVSLDKNSLMTPRKSISAIFGVYPEGNGLLKKNHNPCLYCFKKDCIARRSPAETAN